MTQLVEHQRRHNFRHAQRFQIFCAEYRETQRGRVQMVIVLHVYFEVTSVHSLYTEIISVFIQLSMIISSHPINHPGIYCWLQLFCWIQWISLNFQANDYEWVQCEFVSLTRSLWHAQTCRHVPCSRWHWQMWYFGIFSVGYFFCLYLHLTCTCAFVAKCCCFLFQYY